MAKKKRGPRKFTLPIAPLIGIAAGLVGPIQLAMDGRYDAAMNAAGRNYLGLEVTTGTFHAEWMLKGLVPLILGGLIHKYVGGAPLNVNRMLAAANVPVLRI